MKKLENILLVDDDEVSNFINSEIIGGLDIASHIAVRRNGAEAIEFIEENLENYADRELPYPDLIFLDINMPVMDGFTFLETYKKLTESKKRAKIVVLLTTEFGKAEVELAQKLENIVSAYMEKPLSPEIVHDLIKRYFD